MSKTPVLFVSDDDEPRELPFKWEICGTCRGHGKSSAYLGAYTASEMDEAGPEFMEDYMNGFYDRTCDHCGGGGKVKVADLSRMSKADRAAYRTQLREDAEYEALCEMERRYGA